MRVVIFSSNSHKRKSRCPEKLKKLQDISNKIKSFYAKRILDKGCDQITEDFWQKLLCYNTRNGISEPLDLKISRGGSMPQTP